MEPDGSMSQMEELFMLRVGDDMAVDGGGMDARGCDLTLSGRVLHNFGAYTSGVSPVPLFKNIPSDAKYAFALNLADQVTSASAPDAFFAWASKEIPAQPAILMFLSRDESTIGRCSSVQTVGGTVTVTLVDDRLVGFPDDILSMHSSGDLGSFSRTVRRLMSMQDLAKTCVDNSNALEAAIQNTADVLASRVRKVLDEDSLSNSPWLPRTSPYLDTRGAFPDIAKLFTHVRGPVWHAIEPDSIGGLAARVSIMGGDVIINLSSDENWPDACQRGMATTKPSMVFRVQIPTVNDVSLGTSIYQGQFGRPVSVNVEGTPLSHIVHVIDEAVDAIHSWELETVEANKSNLERKVIRILTSACDASAHDRALSARVRARRLSHALARTLDANLETIKAHLWRPGGRLVAAMMERDRV